MPRTMNVGWLGRAGLGRFWRISGSLQSERSPFVGLAGIVQGVLRQSLAERQGSTNTATTATYTGRTIENTTNVPWPDWIIRPTDEKLTNIREAPNDAGIYGWYSGDGDLMYIGRSIAIATRLQQHRMSTMFFGGDPVFYSYRLVPYQLIGAVEVAHIDTLDPPENRYRDSYSAPFVPAMCAELRKLWEPVLPAQRARLDARSMEIAQQIASRL
jgi:hypothetical protein